MLMYVDMVLIIMALLSETNRQLALINFQTLPLTNNKLYYRVVMTHL